MKNKRILCAILILMSGVTYSANAQSSIDKKQKQELERIKNRRQDLLRIDQEQQRQANEERKQINMNSNQQTINIPPAPNQQNKVIQQGHVVNPNQKIVKQPVAKTPIRKEDINQ